MKQVIKLIILICLSVIVLQGQSQSFGIKLGGTLSSISMNVDSEIGEEVERKLKPGLQIGIVLDIPISEKFDIQPTLQFSNKGFGRDMKKEFEKLGYNVTDFKGRDRVNYNYFELPVNLVYSTSDFKFFGGPYFALGISGSLKTDWSCKLNGFDFESEDFYDDDKYAINPVFGTVDTDMYKESYEDSDQVDFFRAIDYGLNLGIGYRFRDIQVNLSYSHGFANITPKYDVFYYLNDYEYISIDEDYTKNVIMKNRVINLSVILYL